MSTALRKLRVHWIFAVLFVAGIALRVLVTVAYRPALLYIDSFRYLGNFTALDPTKTDPIGYSLILHPLIALGRVTVGGLTLTVVVQHLLGLGMALCLYLIARRYLVPRWLAALACAPVLLDAYQLQIEQNILTDVWQQAGLVLILWLLIGRRAPGAPRWRYCVAAGCLAGLLVTVRTVGVVEVAPVVVFLALAAVWLRRGGPRHAVHAAARVGLRVGVFLLGFCLVLGGYAAYFHSQAGYWGLSGASGRVLYGRTATVADCRALHLDAELAKLCPVRPVGKRAGVDMFTHHPELTSASPRALPPGADLASLEKRFAHRVIAAQPLDLVRAGLGDFVQGFEPGKATGPKQVSVSRWQFQTRYPYYGPRQATQAAVRRFGRPPLVVNHRLAGFLRSYQLGGGYTPGPVLAACGGLGLLAAVGLRFRRGGAAAWRPAQPGIRAAAFLATAAAAAVLLASAAFEFSWRYQLPGLVLLPIAGVLGLRSIFPPRAAPAGTPRPAGEATGAGGGVPGGGHDNRAGGGHESPAAARGDGRRKRVLGAFPDPVDAATLRGFATTYGEPALAPVVIVIAAYDEAESLAPVLAGMPASCAGLDVDVLVVVDGARDRTAEVAAAHHVYTAVAPANRGQGAALRLGYRIAAAHGADYVVTTDADGQYDIAELPALLAPLLDGTADFVTGSRRLGSEESHDRVRWLGVRVFAALASILTATRLTDTSFGFRGMRAELAASVPLRQAQYQSSELLLGALARRARVHELGMSMRIRRSGESKKGSNVAYGINYARAMTSTWLRQYLPRRVFRRSGPAVPTEPDSWRKQYDPAPRT
jgi:hypothetical protein